MVGSEEKIYHTLKDVNEEPNVYMECVFQETFLGNFFHCKF